MDIDTHTHIYIYIYISNIHIVEGSLEVKLPIDGKAEVGRVREEKRREKIREEKESRERVRRKKMQVREKAEQVAIHCVFPMICGSAGSKSRLAKAEAHFQVKSVRS